MFGASESAENCISNGWLVHSKCVIHNISYNPTFAISSEVMVGLPAEMDFESCKRDSLVNRRPARIFAMAAHGTLREGIPCGQIGFVGLDIDDPLYVLALANMGL